MTHPGVPAARPHLRDDGRLQLTDDLAVDPEAVAIQCSWSEEPTRWLGLVPRTRTWLHVELRADSTRVRIRSPIGAAPDDVAHKAAPHDVELDAAAVDALLARLRALGARDVRRTAGVHTSLRPEAPADDPDAIDVEDRHPIRDAEVAETPVLDAADREQCQRAFRAEALVWAALLAALWALAVPHFVEMGATVFPIFVGVPATIILIGRLRACLGHRIVLPQPPTRGWLPQRFHDRRRTQPKGPAGEPMLTALPFWVVWFGFWLSLAQAMAATDVPPAVPIAVGVGLSVVIALDLRVEWRSALCVIGLLRHGRNGVAATRRGPKASVVVDRRSRGSGRSRRAVYRLRESIRCPDTITIWRDGSLQGVATKDATLLSSVHTETSDGHEWRVPRGVQVRYRQVDGALHAFATCGERPMRELWVGLIALGLSTVGMMLFTVLAVVYALVG